jgi:cell wall assembly regulator SMI1
MIKRINFIFESIEGEVTELQYRSSPFACLSLAKKTMQTFETVVAEIKKRFPVYEQLLNPGAPRQAITQFSEKIQREIPESFTAFYAVADGGKPYEIADIEGMTFLSLERVLRDKELFDRILADKQAEGAFFCWHTDWVPFADDFSYDTLVIDTTGKASGSKGCVLKRSKDTFEGDKLCIVAPDFDTFIRGWADRVNSGQVYRQGAQMPDSDNWAADYEDNAYGCVRRAKFTP